MTTNDSVRLRKKIYMIWWHIKERCYNPNDPRYKNYGERGVIMCEEWQNFNVFFQDIKFINGYCDLGILNGDICFDKDSLDITNKVYCKSKCIFISKELNNKFKPSQMKPFIAISPTGEQTKVYNRSEFARVKSLRQSTISDCLSGRIKKHRGWSFINIE